MNIQQALARVVEGESLSREEMAGGDAPGDVR